MTKARWEKANDAGVKALQEARYAEAEQQFEAALKEAENFGPEDSRLAKTLNNLAGVTTPKASTARPSRSTGGRSRSAKRPSGRNIPT